MKRYLPDTNVILNSPSILESLDGEIVSPYVVLQELDKIKMERNTERGFQARQGVRVLKSLGDKVVYDSGHKPKTKKNFWKWLCGMFKRRKVIDNDLYFNNDDAIINYALAHNCIVITGDFLMQLKAKVVGLEVIETDKLDARISYKGYKRVYLSDEEKAHFYENMSFNQFKLLTNQYLLIHDNTDCAGESIDQYRWDGDKHTRLVLPRIQDLKPKNDLQKCALDMLHNSDIPIKIIAGNYGSGKTMLTVKVALHHLKQKSGDISSIMMVRNPIGSGEEIGFLKGDKNEKTEGFFNPIIQHLDGGEQEAERLEQMGQLTKEIPFFMKGLSIDNTFIIADEAEDLNEKLIKLIGTRLGEGSVIAFAGDYAQTENKYMYQNGLLSAIEHLKGNVHVGIIVLEEDLRSDASRVFADFM